VNDFVSLCDRERALDDRVAMRPSRIRVGVIGAGSMGRNHLRIYDSLRDVELAAVADPDRAARDDAAERFGVRTFADHRDMLDQVDAVTVAVPTALHHAVALDCIAAGVHVLVEKPIASSSAQGEVIVRAAADRGVVLQVGHVERFNPAVIEVQRMLRDEQLIAIAAKRLSPPTPRVTDIDVIFDLMIHDIDIALGLSGSHFATLSSVGRPDAPAPLDHVTAHGRLESGVIVELTASKVTHETLRRLEVTTESSYVTVNYLNRDISVSRRAAITGERSDSYAYTRQASLARPHAPDVEPLRQELVHFLSCVRTGQKPVSSGETALEAMRVAETIARTARLTAAGD
jgi:predicted dehydrogenase